MTLLPGSTSHGLFLLADEHEHHEDVEDKKADGGDEKQENRVHLLGLRQGRTMARDILPIPTVPAVARPSVGTVKLTRRGRNEPSMTRFPSLFSSQE